jgi:2-methylisocitrate lyase-like PEP mutase family enzyme
MSADPAHSSFLPRRSAAQRRQDLRELLKARDATIVPGAADALTARLVERAGFACVYVTGAGVANAQLAMPDVGLATMDDVLRVARAVVSAVRLPVIADADTGYGNAINVMRTVSEFEAAGVSGIQLEDQITPKRCGHFEGKHVIDPSEMVAKLRAAILARNDPALAIIARTDAAAVDGIDEALRRARLYRDAGADAIFVEAPRTRAELERIPREVDGIAHVVNIVEGGKTPVLPRPELAAMGFSIALYANVALRAAMAGVIRALAHLRANGNSNGLDDAIVGMVERQLIVGLPEVEALERDLLDVDGDRRHD